MRDVILNKNGLEDDTVDVELANLTGFVRELLLSENQLTRVPTFTDYPQLDTMQVILLSKNHIESLKWVHFPTHAKVIDLSHNQLKMLPAISEYDRCLQVSVLRLTHNKITSITWDQIPIHAENLELSYNQITRIHDLSKSPLKTLRIVDNRLTTMKGEHLPVSLKTLDISGNTVTKFTNAKLLQNMAYVKPCTCHVYHSCYTKHMGFADTYDYCFYYRETCKNYDYFKQIFPHSTVNC